MPAKQVVLFFLEFGKSIKGNNERSVLFLTGQKKVKAYFRLCWDKITWTILFFAEEIFIVIVLHNLVFHCNLNFSLYTFWVSVCSFSVQEKYIILLFEYLC